MPVATDNEFIVEQRLWTLALAWPGLTTLVKPANRIRLDQLNVLWPESAKLARASADTPELKLDVVSSRPDPKAPRTFCLQPDVNVVSFEWTLVGGARNINGVTQVKAELKACMIAAGTQLGVPASVAKWEWSWRTGKASKSERTIIVTQAVTIKG